MGGPKPGNRTTLALFTAARHPGIAVAIATTNFPQQKLVLPTVLLYLLVNAMRLICIPELATQGRNSKDDQRWRTYPPELDKG